MQSDHRTQTMANTRFLCFTVLLGLVIGMRLDQQSNRYESFVAGIHFVHPFFGVFLF